MNNVVALILAIITAFILTLIIKIIAEYCYNELPETKRIRKEIQDLKKHSK